MGREKNLGVICFFLAAILLGGISWAADDEAALQAVTGKWTFKTSNHWSKGVCPAGTDSTGTLTISKTAQGYQLILTSGVTCRPASMCVYALTVSGDTYTAANSAKVDSEGGQAKNAIVFKLSSKTSAAGKSDSSYTHPGGMKCTWGFEVALTKAE